MITAAQIRAARALLRLDQSELARRAEVSLATLRRVERGAQTAHASSRAVASIQHALETAGAEFIDNGVKYKQSRTPEDKDRMRQDLKAIAHRSAKFLADNPGGFAEDELYDEFGLPT